MTSIDGTSVTGSGSYCFAAFVFLFILHWCLFNLSLRLDSSDMDFTLPVSFLIALFVNIFDVAQDPLSICLCRIFIRFGSGFDSTKDSEHSRGNKSQGFLCVIIQAKISRSIDRVSEARQRTFKQSSHKQKGLNLR